jgi:NADH pyrophosphatase NudC (nudix superfamily)
MSKPQLISIADDNDNIIGFAVRDAPLAPRQNPMIAAVLLFNSHGNIILQRISFDKKDDYDAGKWSYSAGGHVDVGETYEVAALRELFEEMGIVGKIEKYIGKTRTVRNGIPTAFHHGFKVIHDGPYNYDKTEVSEIREFTIDEVKKMIAANPNNFKQTFVDIFNQL